MDELIPTPIEQAIYRVRWYRRPDPVNWRVREGAGPDPWLAITSADLLPWWAAHPEATCSERTARALAWLEETWGRSSA